MPVYTAHIAYNKSFHGHVDVEAESLDEATALLEKDLNSNWEFWGECSTSGSTAEEARICEMRDPEQDDDPEAEMVEDHYFEKTNWEWAAEFTRPHVLEEAWGKVLEWASKTGYPQEEFHSLRKVFLELGMGDI
jgi:hypothetical protein